MRIVAVWQSRGGKYRVELRADARGYVYVGTNAGGNLGAMASDEVAIAEMERRLAYLQADANKTPMKREV